MSQSLSVANFVNVSLFECSLSVNSLLFGLLIFMGTISIMSMLSSPSSSVAAASSSSLNFEVFELLTDVVCH